MNEALLAALGRVTRIIVEQHSVCISLQTSKMMKKERNREHFERTNLSLMKLGRGLQGQQELKALPSKRVDIVLQCVRRQKWDEQRHRNSRKNV